MIVILTFRSLTSPTAFWKLPFINVRMNIVEMVKWVVFHSFLQPNSNIRKRMYIYSLSSLMFMTFIGSEFFLAACWIQTLFINCFEAFWMFCCSWIILCSQWVWREAWIRKRNCWNKKQPACQLFLKFVSTSYAFGLDINCEIAFVSCYLKKFFCKSVYCE